MEPTINLESKMTLLKGAQAIVSDSNNHSSRDSLALPKSDIRRPLPGDLGEVGLDFLRSRLIGDRLRNRLPRVEK